MLKAAKFILRHVLAVGMCKQAEESHMTPSDQREYSRLMTQVHDPDMQSILREHWSDQYADRPKDTYGNRLPIFYAVPRNYLNKRLNFPEGSNPGGAYFGYPHIMMYNREWDSMSPYSPLRKLLFRNTSIHERSHSDDINLDRAYRDPGSAERSAFQGQHGNIDSIVTPDIMQEFSELPEEVRQRFPKARQNATHSKYDLFNGINGTWPEYPIAMSMRSGATPTIPQEAIEAMTNKYYANNYNDPEGTYDTMENQSARNIIGTIPRNDTYSKRDRAKSNGSTLPPSPPNYHYNDFIGEPTVDPNIFIDGKGSYPGSSGDDQDRFIGQRQDLDRIPFSTSTVKVPPKYKFTQGVTRMGIDNELRNSSK